MTLRKANKENQKLAALQKKEKPTRLTLPFYRFDLNRISDIIATAAKLGITLNREQAVRYAIRHSQLNEATTSDFTEILNDDV
jgi:hypothetical protein